MNVKKYAKILTKGFESSLSKTAIGDGILRFTIDTRELYLDQNGTRIKISDIESSYTEEKIFEILAPLPKIYIASDTHRAYINTGTEWVDLAAIKLKLADIKDLDLPIWFSSKNAENPTYNEDLTYNTNKKELKSSNVTVTSTLKVGGMIITDTKNNDQSHLVEFSFS